MKPGDKVFHFNGKEIIEGVCTSTYQFASGQTFVNCHFPGANYVDDPYHLRHGEWFADAILWEEVFPTREALCEHYRKIFE